jgi:ABC-type transport system involved in cytochrome bd biosynthesis fused ATPase/permease subunit
MQQHPLIFALVVGITTIILFVILRTNVVIFFFILMAAIGWNSGNRIRKSQSVNHQLNDGFQDHITKIDNMMKKR